MLLLGGQQTDRAGSVQMISGDHAGSAIPHVHADIGSGEVVVELTPAGVRLSEAHSGAIRGKITKNELRIVLRTARDSYQQLIELWEESQS
jgi:hypothetical protein